MSEGIPAGRPMALHNYSAAAGNLSVWAESAARTEKMGTERFQAEHALRTASDMASAVANLQLTAVTLARLSGLSWADIGKGLGMTKQAAQQKYGPTIAGWEAKERQRAESAAKYREILAEMEDR